MAIRNTVHIGDPHGRLPRRFRGRKQPRLIGLLSILAVNTSSCDEPVDIVCTEELRPALIVSALDSVSEAPVSNAIMWVRDGTFVDTLDVYGNMGYGPSERPGRYTVNVEAHTYQSWTLTDVEVTAGVCHVNTVELTAKLQTGGEPG